ncbi:hypothetical protein EPI10_028444 [Gossypium australe]|uniref:Uncharacterized protein n=1 Tax=Gossypium australe TaxID=47621 RepID=A0A5B6UUY2_9ROSI|nr:hypothetical protein EPI10_028444 [Gossypium australe]
MGELRYELHSLFGQYLGHQNLSISNTKTLDRGKGILEGPSLGFAPREPIKVSTRGQFHVLEKIYVIESLDKDKSQTHKTTINRVYPIPTGKLTTLHNVDEFTVDWSIANTNLLKD